METVLSFQDKILALGGHDGVTRHNSVEMFDPVTRNWSDLPSMTTRRSDLAVVAYQEKVYAIGGFTGEVGSGWLSFSSTCCRATFDVLVRSTRHSHLFRG